MTDIELKKPTGRPVPTGGFVGASALADQRAISDQTLARICVVTASGIGT